MFGTVGAIRMLRMPGTIGIVGALRSIAAFRLIASIVIVTR
jgi:hypothetical protein